MRLLDAMEVAHCPLFDVFLSCTLQRKKREREPYYESGHQRKRPRKTLVLSFSPVRIQLAEDEFVIKSAVCEVF
jgi:hypothetical protein